MPPLSGLRVVDLSTWIAGAYCTKLLADGGADVVKVEPPSGDPLRRWSASGATIADGDDGALFDYLAASKQSVVVDRRSDPTSSASLHALLASRRRRRVVTRVGGRRAPDARAGRAPRAPTRTSIVTSITPFGLDGPWSDRPATEFTLQAWSGGDRRARPRRPDRAPVHVGGQIGEWLTGVFAAIGTLASLRARRRSTGELVDVSMLEVMAIVPHLLPGHLPRPARLPDAEASASCRRPGVGRRVATASSGSAAAPDSSGSTSAPWSATPSGRRTRSLLPRPHRARADDRRLGRRAHGRRGARPGLRVPDPQRADRRRRERHRRSTTSSQRGAFVANPRDG